jgi:hypothetical protein
MLYLPGLKNVIADFLSRPNQTTTHWISRHRVGGRPSVFRRDGRRAKPLPRNAAALNWLSARQALNAWLEMFPKAIFAQLFPSNSEKTFLIIFTKLLTPGGSPPVVLFNLGLCGTVFPATSPPWARRCLACQQGKIHRHTHLVPLPIPQ